jgi:nitroimidazol reductase NimA-like FMN-containing flavoprotein (pyridoxamine 5'-phosphate oxidase superfamily)
MPSRRELIAMTPNEVRSYLAGRDRIVVSTNGPGGLPHSVPLDYGLDDQGRILVTSFRKSQKVRNLERDPRATLLVESGESYAELKGLMAYADAEIVVDADQIRQGMRLIHARPALAESMSDAMTGQVRASLAKRVLIRFTPFRTVSWDHGKLAGFY